MHGKSETRELHEHKEAWDPHSERREPPQAQRHSKERETLLQRSARKSYANTGYTETRETLQSRDRSIHGNARINPTDMRTPLPSRIGKTSTNTKKGEKPYVHYKEMQESREHYANTWYTRKREKDTRKHEKTPQTRGIQKREISTNTREARPPTGKGTLPPINTRNVKRVKPPKHKETQKRHSNTRYTETQEKHTEWRVKKHEHSALLHRKARIPLTQRNERTLTRYN